MIDNKYTCDGQIELESYLQELEESTKKCQNCIYFHDFKCVRKSCHKLDSSEGWKPLWYDVKGRVYGEFITCQEWEPIETVIEGKEIYVCDANGKDKTFRWPKDTKRQFNDDVIAWRYKEKA